MAEYLDSAITGSFTLPLVMSESIANTGSAGGLYYNLSKNRVYYTHQGEESIQAGTWSAGGATITALRSYATLGSQTEAMTIGGRNPGSTVTTCVQEYNGTSWATGTAAPMYRRESDGTGTQNSGLVGAGVVPVPSGEIPYCAIEWNGTSWSNTGNTVNRHWTAGITGTQNSAVMIGGRTQNPYAEQDKAEDYDGTSWSSITDYPTNIRSRAGIVGPSSNDIVHFGGYVSPTGTCNNYSWDGSSWSLHSSFPSKMRNGDGFGTSNAYVQAYAYCAETSYMGNNCIWNGTSWSAGNSMINNTTTTKRGSGNGTAGWIASGYNAPTNDTYTEEYSGTVTPPGITSTIIGSYASGSNTLLTSGSAFPVNYALSGTWNAGPNRAQCLYAPVVTGDLDSSLAVGGRAMPASGVNGYLKCTEHYDGYSWSTGGALSNGSYLQNMWGSQNAAVRAGGYCYPSPNAQACTEEYNGSSWSTGPNLPAARYGGVSAGTQNDGIMSAGNDGTNQQTTTYTWNGTSWATGTAKITTMRYGGGVGETSNNLFAAQGYINPAVTNNVEHWNGSSWSSCTSAPVAQSAITAGGIGVNDYVSASGTGTDTISWNGSAWAAQATSPSDGYNYQSVVRGSKGIMQVGHSQTSPYRSTATCLYTRDTN